MAQKTTSRNRSAKTGKYVTKRHARTYPKITVNETIARQK